MSLFDTSYAGLKAQAAAIQVTSNNVSNSSTTGYKARESLFVDQYFKAVQSGGSSGISDFGTKRVDQQGGLKSSTSALDLAIQGQGMFVLSSLHGSGGSQLFSRNGSFSVDNQGYMVNANGLYLNGYQPNSSLTGIVNAAPSALKMPPNVVAPLASSVGTVSANLDTRSAQPLVVEGGVPTAISKTFLASDTSTFNSSTTVQSYDSKGLPHQVTMFFKKIDPTVVDDPRSITTPKASATAVQYEVYIQADGYTLTKSAGGNGGVASLSSGDAAAAAAKKLSDMAIAAAGNADQKIGVFNAAQKAADNAVAMQGAQLEGLAGLQAPPMGAGLRPVWQAAKNLSDATAAYKAATVAQSILTTDSASAAAALTNPSSAFADLGAAAKALADAKATLNHVHTMVNSATAAVTLATANDNSAKQDLTAAIAANPEDAAVLEGGKLYDAVNDPDKGTSALLVLKNQALTDLTDPGGELDLAQGDPNAEVVTGVALAQNNYNDATKPTAAADITSMAAVEAAYSKAKLAEQAFIDATTTLTEAQAALTTTLSSPSLNLATTNTRAADVIDAIGAYKAAVASAVNLTDAVAHDDSNKESLWAQMNQSKVAAQATFQANADSVSTTRIGTLQFVDGQLVGSLTKAGNSDKPSMPAEFSAQLTDTKGNALCDVKLDLSAMTAFGSNFQVYDASADGYAPGSLTGVSVDQTGVVTGQYTNGKTLTGGQLVLASFASADNLDPISGSVFSATFASGPAVMGTATTSSYGAVRSQMLEQSNIDMAAELVNLMIEQRNYQANSQGINAANTVMTTAINMGR